MSTPAARIHSCQDLPLAVVCGHHSDGDEDEDEEMSSSVVEGSCD